MKKLTCIVCPLGCEITARMDGDKIAELSGQGCQRGEAYARTELIDPRRMLTTTMRVKGDGLVAVKSAQALPKGALMVCMEAIKKQTATAPINIGDVLIEDICGTGVRIVATGRVAGV